MIAPNDHPALPAILDRLSGVKPNGQNGDSWMARCPSHNDKNPSLCVSLGSKGGIVLRCFSNKCTPQQIVAALGLSMADLAPPNSRNGKSGRKRSRASARQSSPAKAEAAGEVKPPTRCVNLGVKGQQLADEYTRTHGSECRVTLWKYQDSTGRDVAAVLRLDPADGSGKKISQFRRRFHDEPGRLPLWENSGLPAPRPLYRLLDLAQADLITVHEGEKSADAARSLGFVATTSMGGSKAPDKTDWSPLAGKRVVVFPDADEPGEAYLATLLTIFATFEPRPTVSVVRLPGLSEGGDIFDWVEAKRATLSLEAMRAEIDAFIAAAPVIDLDRPPQLSNGSGDSTGLPEVRLPGGDVPIKDSAAEFGRLLGATGDFYHRGSVPMRLVIADDGEKILQPIRAAELCSDLETVAKLVKVRKTEDGEELIPAICPESNARVILASSCLRSELPEIKVISRCPVLTERNGELVIVCGFDRESGILAGGEPPEEMPVDEAVELLHMLLADFQFATPGDAARALAAFICPAMVASGLLPGRSPVDLSEADRSQAGKGFRSKLVCAIYDATPGIVTQRASGGVGSLQEAFDAQVIAGRLFICFDNIRGKLDLPGLESFLTEDRYAARVPYSGQITIDPRRIVVAATSNSAQVTTDLANRSSAVRILKQPPGYEFRSYPEGDLLDHVRANRSQYLGAVFAIIREWHRRGKPMLPHADHDFRGWARTLGWLSQNVMGTGDLLAGHRAAQERIASPGLTWLRDVALAVLKSGADSQWLRPFQLLEIIADSGCDQELTEAVDGDDAQWHNAVRKLGRKLTRNLAADSVEIDNITVRRRKSFDEGYREQREYAFFPQTLNTPECAPNQNLVTLNPPNHLQHNMSDL